MADDFDSEDEKESGGSLRKKLEAALEENRALKGEVTSFKAHQLIQEKGFKHLTVDDLKGVDLSELETKAAELEAQKEQQAAVTLRRVLEGKGLKDSELDQALQALLSEEDPAGAALDRIRQVSKVNGTPPAKVEEEGLFGPSRLRAAYAKK